MQHAEHAAQLMAAGAYEDAARVWRMATSADPSAAPYHSGLGGAQAALGNFDVAQQSYERALAIQPRFAGEEQALVHVWVDCVMAHDVGRA